jgi:hypothetical protein
MVLTKKAKKPINAYIKALKKYAEGSVILLTYNLNKPQELFALNTLIEAEAIKYAFEAEVEGTLHNVDAEVQFCGLRPYWETYVFDFIEAYGYITLDVIKKIIQQNIE